VAFILEELDPTQNAFFMARAGISCSMRLDPLPELLLLQLPFVVGGLCMVTQIAFIVRYILSGILTLRGSHSQKYLWLGSFTQFIVFLCGFHSHDVSADCG
jgi:hypothetical protein